MSACVQIVQFAGQCVTYNDGAEWHVTHAVVSNSLEVLEPAARAAHNRSVEELVKANNLTHVGWLRQASAACPLSSLDMDTQRVRRPLPPSVSAAAPRRGLFVWSVNSPSCLW